VPREHWPRVSIVTPSYNQGAFIEETLRSVLLQGYPNLEYLVIDGGSTDETVDIIRRYAPHLTYWVTEPDRGQSHAINKGFARASGEILAWLNSDDTYTPGALHRAARAVVEHPNAAGVYGDAYVRDLDVGIVSYRHSRPIDAIALVRLGCVIPQPTVFLRRQVLARVGPVDEGLHFALDYDLWLRCSLVAPLHYLYGPPLAGESRHPAQKSVAEAHKFGPEILRVALRLFSRPDLPSALKRERRAALARAYYGSARSALLGDQAMRDAARWWVSAVAMDPRYLLRLPAVAIRGLSMLLEARPGRTVTRWPTDDRLCTTSSPDGLCRE
jgi:glycosyltransferase involved in cell wall biosynthesis